MPMPNNPDRDARVSPPAPYRKPSLAVYGKMTDLTETGMGSVKRQRRDEKNDKTGESSHHCPFSITPPNDFKICARPDRPLQPLADAGAALFSLSIFERSLSAQTRP